MGQQKANRENMISSHHGEWYSFSCDPIIDGSAWYANGANLIPREYEPKNYTGDWKDSLRMNPKYEEKK